MNRNEEYWALVAELGETPPALDGTVERAVAGPVRQGRAAGWESPQPPWPGRPPPSFYW